MRYRPDERPSAPQRDLEHRCRALEAQLRDLQRTARIGTWEWDPRAGTVTWSPLMWSLHGMDPEPGPLTPDEALQHVHADDRDRLAAIFTAGWSGEPAEFDYRIKPNGTTTVLHARTRVERGEDGRLLRVVGTSQDLTEERRQEGVREKAFLASIVDSSSDAILTKDVDGTITSWNPAAAELFGYAADEIIGKSVTLLFPPERLAEEAGIIARIRTGERVQDFETQRLSKDGDRVDVSVAVSPLLDRDGRIVGASSMMRDITRRKRELARERAAMDAEIRRLDEMGRFRARFINVAAHELKTPLTPIRLQLQLLQMQLKEPPPKVEHALDVLTRSVERLRTIMDDVLDAARVQATQLKLRMQRLDLGAIVYEALETYAPVAKKVQVRLHVDLPGPAEVEGDATRLLQVVNNVVSNALKFTPPGGKLEVGLKPEDGMAVLTVQDTGRGLSAQQRQQLFQPFAQVHPDLEATSKGSGLGLYIVKAIVEQHRGTIRIDSKGPDRGTTVTVRIPLASASAKGQALEAPSASSVQGSHASGPPAPGSRQRPGRAPGRRRIESQRAREAL